jgi:hypothetical protein
MKESQMRLYKSKERRGMRHQMYDNYDHKISDVFSTAF